MKLTKLVFAFIALLGITVQAQAQTQAYKGKQVALNYYMFALDESFQLFLEDVIEEQGQETVDLMGPDPIEEFFMHKTYDRVEAFLEEKMGIDLLPKETLDGQVTYDVRGYPLSKAKKAAKKSDHPYYLRITVQMMPRDVVEDELTVNQVKGEKRKIKPIVTVKTTLSDENGQEIFKATGKSKGQKWIHLDMVTFYGFVSMEGKTLMDDQTTLMDVLDDALEELRKDMPQ